MYIGRVIVSIASTKLTFEEEILLQHPMVFGVVLFLQNYIDKPGLGRLIREIQLAGKSSYREDMPVFVDQEGGVVQRFKKDFTILPSAQEFGECEADFGSAIKSARFFGSIMAKELAEFGISSLAPVLNIGKECSIIGRSRRGFHKEAVECSLLAEGFIDGMNEEGMQAIGKHFPGHGSVSGDSHESTPVDNRTYREIDESDLIPFKRLISMGKISAVMTSLIQFPQVCDNVVALSAIWLNDILRDRLGFKGVVVSDCLSMVGAGTMSMMDKVKRAFQCNNDILIISHQTPAEYLELFAGLSIEEYALSLEQSERVEKWVGGRLSDRRCEIREEPTPAL